MRHPHQGLALGLLPFIGLILLIGAPGCGAWQLETASLDADDRSELAAQIDAVYDELQDSGEYDPSVLAAARERALDELASSSLDELSHDALEARTEASFTDLATNAPETAAAVRSSALTIHPPSAAPVATLDRWASEGALSQTVTAVLDDLDASAQAEGLDQSVGGDVSIDVESDGDGDGDVDAVEVFVWVLLILGALSLLALIF